MDAGKEGNDDAMTLKTEELKNGNAAYWCEADNNTNKEDNNMAESEVGHKNEV